MVAKNDDDIYQRIGRLETLIAFLIATNTSEDRDLDFLFRLFDDFRRIDSKEFSYLMADALRFRRRSSEYAKPDAHFRNVGELYERTAELSNRIDRITALDDIKSLTTHVEKLSRDVDLLKEETSALRREAYENFAIDSMGLVVRI